MVSAVAALYLNEKGGREATAAFLGDGRGREHSFQRKQQWSLSVPAMEEDARPLLLCSETEGGVCVASEGSSSGRAPSRERGGLSFGVEGGRSAVAEGSSSGRAPSP